MGSGVTKQVKQLDRVIIRFAGDSGDGMQLTGDRFTQETAAFGNDLSTLPSFPAEIRAPQGTLAGVSSFQVHFADHDIVTPGDSPDVLVAMNPAALKANLGDLKKGATVIVDSHDFTTRNLAKAGYEQSPLDTEELAEYAVHPFDLTDMTVEAVKEFGLSRKDSARVKNMFALGMLSWMYGRPTEGTLGFLERRFAKAPAIRDANVTAFKAGWNFATADTDPADILVHDVHAEDPTTAFALSRLTDSGHLDHAPVGIFRSVEHPTFDDQARDQIRTAKQGTTYDDQARDQIRTAKQGTNHDPATALTGLLASGETWTSRGQG